ncbi:MAG TPA: hypothetical protein PLL15_10820, partial [Syntrophales bacterium]|nr:hypothetical protein [Syntrophales bacterium]
LPFGVMPLYQSAGEPPASFFYLEFLHAFCYENARLHPRRELLKIAISRLAGPFSTRPGAPALR